MRLPTEDEWEHAARGDVGREFPWGDRYESGYANIDETWEGERVGPYFLGQTSTVGIYPQGATLEGICDLSGNVWEWTGTIWESREVDITSPAARVLRGGSWVGVPRLARGASRHRFVPLGRYGFVGFRVVSSAPAVDTLDSGSPGSGL